MPFPIMALGLQDRFTKSTLYRRAAQLVIDEAVSFKVEKDRNVNISLYSITDLGRRKLEMLKHDLARLRAGENLDAEYPRPERDRRERISLPMTEVEIKDIVKKTANSVFDLARTTG